MSDFFEPPPPPPEKPTGSPPVGVWVFDGFAWVIEELLDEILEPEDE